MKYYRASSLIKMSDKKWDLANPIQQSCKAYLPSLRCPVCGVWASSERLRGISYEPKAVFDPVLNLGQWVKLRQKLACDVRIDEQAVQPGSEVGPPILYFARKAEIGFLHYRPGRMYIDDRSMNLLSKYDLRGLDFNLASICASSRFVPKFAYFEIEYSVAIKQVGDPDQFYEICKSCGRVKYHEVDLSIPARRSCSADIGMLNGNSNDVVVSERFRAAVLENNIKNLAFDS